MHQLSAWVGVPFVLTAICLGLGLMVSVALSWLLGRDRAVAALTDSQSTTQLVGAGHLPDALAEPIPGPLAATAAEPPASGQALAGADPEQPDPSGAAVPPTGAGRPPLPAVRTVAVIPLGLAAAVVVTTALTWLPAAARWTTPVTLGLALAGLVVGLRSHLPLRMPRVGLAAAAVYCCYSAPAAVGGSPFSGWIKLDDGSTWLAFTDQLVTNGRVTTGLAPSTYETTLAVNWPGSYPVGAFPLLGVAAKTLGLDAAFTVQPYLSWLAAVLALTLGALLVGVVPSRGVRAVGVFLAAQPALLLGYALWGGVKELVLAPLVALVAYAAASAKPAPGDRQAWARAAALIPVALTGAAIILVAGISGLVWLVGAAVVLGVRWVRATGWLTSAAWAAGTIAVMLLLAAPQLREFQVLGNRLAYATVGPNGGADIGNLWGRLPVAQLAGIWPVGDFRATPTRMGIVWLMIAAVLVLAGLGLAHAARERSPEVPTYMLTTLPVALFMALRGGVWVAGKAMAIASPVLLTAAVAGCAWLLSRDRTAAVGGFALAAITMGVLTGTWLGYRAVWLAPAGQLQELSAIGTDPELPTPALMLDYSPYGARHFLRELDAQGAGELRRDLIPMRSGVDLQRAAYGDIDQFPTSSLAMFNTLVLRNSVRASRPPADFELARSGMYYDVWVRNPSVAVLSHLNLGDDDQPGATPKCQVITELARTAPDGAELAYVVRPPVVTAVPGPLPAGWSTAADGTILATSSASMYFTVDVAQAGTYYGWLGGSFRGHVVLRVGDQVILDQRQILNWPGHGTPTSAVELPTGNTRITLDYDLPAWQPGAQGTEFTFGPLLLATTSGAEDYTTISPAQSQQLCGQPLDWVAVIAKR